jgi:hypothetical protein
MLVVISDLHLTDGSSGATISPGAFEIFAERLQDLAAQASWRSDGGYRPIESIDLLLLGDVLDVIRSTRWSLIDRVRPWTDPRQPEFSDLVTQITKEILIRNDSSLAVLRSLATEDQLTLPPATGRGQPAVDAPRQPVGVNIHYMVGNHDWFYHLRGAPFDALRQLLVRQMGLCNPHDIPFPHDPHENDALLDVMRRHKVFARHGDLYDPFNFEGDRDNSSLGDCIVIELVNRFATEVEHELAGDLPPSTIAGLREIDNIRPLLLIPVWIEGLLERTCPYQGMRREVKRVWDRLADRFLDLQYVRAHDTWNPNDLVDGLQNALKFSKRIPLGWASSVLNWLSQLRGGDGESFYRHALGEQDFRNRRARSIVYGHTHQVENVPLDASYAEGYVLNQIYFNSGTWRRVHRPTRLAPQEHEFIPSDEMTYLAFFQGDERAGRPFETWTGTLGINPSTSPVLRVDPGRSKDAAVQSLSPSGLPGHAPHFAPSIGKAGVIPTRRK